MVQRYVYIAMVLAGVVVGCARETPEQTASSTPAKVHEQIFEDGPVTLTVAVDKQEAAIADPIRLTLTAVAPDQVDVELPNVADALSDLEVRDTSAMTPVRLEDGRWQWSQTYALEGYAAGVFEIPSLIVTYADRRETESAATSQPASQPATTGQVVSDAVPITIASALQGESDPTAFRDIKSLAEVSIERDWTWLWWAVGIVLIVVILVVVWRKRQRQRDIEQARIIIPPHEWAMGQLAQLSAEDLVGQGRIHEYYFRLSRITREYIERRFSVSAPEMTTEEFLIGVRDARYFDDGQKRALANFLEACDLVKFAKYQPSSSEIEHAFNAAGDFVSQTAALSQDVASPARAEVAA